MKWRPSVLIALAAIVLSGPSVRAGALDDLDKELTALASRVSKSVVAVRTEPKVSLGADRLPGFPMALPGQRTNASGVVYDRAGHIVTVASAVRRGRKVAVTLPDGRTVPAEVKGRDPASNLAVLKVDVDGLVPAVWGSSAAVKPGSVVVAAGHSFGMGPSVTLGVVSAVGRSVGGHADLIQITAPINPGDSGGMLANSKGELIGIITATFGRGASSDWLDDFFKRTQPEKGRDFRSLPKPYWLEPFEPGHSFREGLERDPKDAKRDAPRIETRAFRSGPRDLRAYSFRHSGMPAEPRSEVRVLAGPHMASQGMNYALPADTVKVIVNQLIKDGKVSRGFLGVEIRARTDGEPGVRVADVVEDSPAAKAGLKPGDRILTVGERKVNSWAQFARTVARRPPGTRVELQLRRGEKTLTLAVVLAEWPGVEDVAPRGDVEVEPVPAAPRKPLLGIHFQPLTEELARHFGVKDGRGVLVAAVKPGSPAGKAGLEVGDCIVAMEKEPVADARALRALTRKHAGKTVTLDLIRDRKPHSVQVALPARPSIGRGLKEAEEALKKLLDEYRNRPELKEYLRKLEQDLEELRRKAQPDE